MRILPSRKARSISLERKRKRVSSNCTSPSFNDPRVDDAVSLANCVATCVRKRDGHHTENMRASLPRACSSLSRLWDELPNSRDHGSAVLDVDAIGSTQLGDRREAILFDAMLSEHLEYFDRSNLHARMGTVGAGERHQALERRAAEQVRAERRARTAVSECTQQKLPAGRGLNQSARRRATIRCDRAPQTRALPP